MSNRPRLQSRMNAAPPGSRLLWENDRLLVVQQNAAIQMVADSAGKHTPFDIAALADEAVRRIEVGDPLDILLDDRTFIQIAGYVVGRRADQLHATVECLMVGLCALEARQERVVDVEAAAV